VNRILVAGAPRSGTTWLAATLGTTPGSSLVNEPDNQVFNAAASESAEVYGGYPVLLPGQRAPEYERLWDPVFHAKQPSVTTAWHGRRFGRRRDTAAAPETVIAKSVFAAFALDWLVARYAPSVVLIERDPCDVVSSWMRLDFVVGDLATREPIRSGFVERLGLPAWDPAAPRLLQVAWAVGVLMSAMRDQSRARPEWKVVSYETLCRDRATVQGLAASLGLRWSDQAEAAARHPAEPRNYAQDERRAVADFLSQFPELASWFEVESRV
jgi:hypothetical protein